LVKLQKDSTSKTLLSRKRTSTLGYSKSSCPSRKPRKKMTSIGPPEGSSKTRTHKTH